ncbi:tetratricopeptide repeat protein [Spirosoma rhododendri]|uniref:Tetratricopeptide repeat protein n=1 Tax=Spirosoma rhododendri TaxID=2728024 RepID=A0A7L5DMH4_9BACT|nr:tetratricopeptide repeat protein [Spirosoma rhododendri]QJD79325.1 tetratricopeptide repeat protein [Spirosoma rhododendri]
MNELETIENYVNGLLSPDERARFDAELAYNSALAESLAFYVLTQEVARQQALDTRKAELAALRTRPVPSEASVRPLWGSAGMVRWLAVAASVVLVLAVGYYALRPKTDTLAALTTTYANERFGQLPVTMGGKSDDVQQGIARFNDGQIARADSLFETALRTQPQRDDALTYAGITAFRLGQYDRAIDRFQRLGQLPGRFANPGPYYEALARLRRNLPDDKSRAKGLLEQVVRQNLVGAKEAERLLATNNL